MVYECGRELTTYLTEISHSICFGSISWEQIDGIRLTNLAYALTLTCQNFVSTQYLVNKLMEFDQILHMVGIVIYLS